MEIKYFGHSTFLLKNKTTSVVTDPYDPEIVSLKFPKHTECDIVTISHDHRDHNYTQILENSPFVVKGKGEYEIKGVSIIGINSYHDKEKGAQRGKNTIYRIEMDNLAIVHMGDLGHVLSSEELDEIDGVDILLIPVGGTYTINASEAKNIINEIEPSIVIPMHYGRSELSGPEFAELADLKVFFAEMGKEMPPPIPKLSISKEKLPPEMQIVILE
jgi:L-ascorbate metabolism protein UlaG (beta-lactamase superfamily)